MPTNRTDERAEFWSDVLTTAIENYGCASWFTVDEYRPYLDAETAQREGGWAATPHEAYAIITIVDEDVDEHGKTFRVDADLLARGLSKLDSARLNRAHQVLDAGDIDVVDALNILECGIFGEVMYG